MGNVLPFRPRIAVTSLGVHTLEGLRATVVCLVPQFFNHPRSMRMEEVLQMAEGYGYIPLPCGNISEVLDMSKDNFPSDVHTIHVIQRMEFQRKEGQCQMYVLIPGEHPPHVPVERDEVEYNEGVAFCFMRPDGQPSVK